MARPFTRLPVALKDLFDIAGVPTTAASAQFKHRVATSRCHRCEPVGSGGRGPAGKQNLQEFAYGGSSVVSAYGPVRNARNPEYIARRVFRRMRPPLSAGLCFAALGTDTLVLFASLPRFAEWSAQNRRSASSGTEWTRSR